MTMNEFSDFLGTAKKISVICMGLSAPVAVYAKADDILYALGNLTAQVKSAEIAGVKLEFGEAAIRKYVRPDLFSHLSSSERRAVASDLQSLDTRAAVRLMSLSFLNKPCEYEYPKHEMAQDYAADIFLREHELATLEFDEEERKAIIHKIDGNGGKSDIGYPRVCYGVKLTDRGINVRTALIHVFAANLANTLGEKEPPTPKPYREAAN